MTLRYLFLTVAMPTAVAGVTLVPAVLARRQAAPAGAAATEARHWALPLAIGAAFVAGAPMVMGAWPALPPVLAEGWVVYLAMVATLLGIAASWRARGFGWLGGVEAVLLCAAIIALPLRAAAMRMMGTGMERVAWIAGIAALTLLPWGAIGLASTRMAGCSLPLAMLGVTSGSAAAMVLGGNAKLGQAEALLACAMGCVVVAALFRRGFAAGGGGGWLTPLMSLHGAVWLIVGFYSRTPRAAVVLGLLAPGMTAVGLVPAVGRMKEPWRTVVVVGAAWAVTAGAVAWVGMMNDE